MLLAAADQGRVTRERERDDKRGGSLCGYTSFPFLATRKKPFNHRNGRLLVSFAMGREREGIANTVCGDPRLRRCIPSGLSETRQILQWNSRNGGLHLYVHIMPFSPLRCSTVRVQ